MNKIEHLLTCLVEECTEIGQATTKAQRFGLDDVNPGTHNTNRSDIVKEVNDLIGVLELLQECGVELPGLYDREAINAKKERLLIWMSRSEQLGLIQN